MEIDITSFISNAINKLNSSMQTPAVWQVSTQKINEEDIKIA